MRMVDQGITVEELESLAKATFGNLVKAVVDIERRVMAVGGELHSDEEMLLLEQGSRQEHLWGINLYPELGQRDPDFIEFDSMINLRPSQNNRSRDVESPDIRQTIVEIVSALVVPRAA